MTFLQGTPKIRRSVHSNLQQKLLSSGRWPLFLLYLCRTVGCVVGLDWLFDLAILPSTATCVRETWTRSLALLVPTAPKTRVDKDGGGKHFCRHNSGSAGGRTGKHQPADSDHRTRAAQVILVSLVQQEPSLPLHQESELHHQHAMFRRHGHRREELLKRFDDGDSHESRRGGAVLGERRR